MFEELPAPFGLVRYGVAPDHPEVKVRFRTCIILPFLTIGNINTELRAQIRKDGSR